MIVNTILPLLKSHVQAAAAPVLVQVSKLWALVHHFVPNFIMGMTNKMMFYSGTVKITLQEKWFMKTLHFILYFILLFSIEMF